MRDITIAGFLLCGAVMALLVVRSHRDPLRLAPFSALLDVVLADRAARFTILLFWWWLGWHFLASPPSP